MTSDFRSYYVRHVMGRISDLQFGVIGIGIALLALNYLGLVTMTDLRVFQLDVFWRRVALLALVIVFAAYCAIVYNAYGLRAIDDGGKPLSVSNPFRLFIMFLLDIAHLTIIAAMYGVLYIPDTWDLLNSEACRVSLQQCLAVWEQRDWHHLRTGSDVARRRRHLVPGGRWSLEERRRSASRLYWRTE
ncbi:MAG: hypothetical protein U5O39_11270 [Gammaproteobacteria bacterium]|nr:hypothetical protein [Gammaproteobacteria bacterium]